MPNPSDEREADFIEPLKFEWTKERFIARQLAKKYMESSVPNPSTITRDDLPPVFHRTGTLVIPSDWHARVEGLRITINDRSLDDQLRQHFGGNYNETLRMADIEITVRVLD